MEKLVFSSAEFAETIEDTIKDGGCVPLVVTGSSMNPFFVDGKDTVWLRTCTDADLARGKVLLFKRKEGSLVLHRVRKVLPNGELLMNGDAQSWCEKINIEQVIAVVGEVERHGKKKSCEKNTLWQMFKPIRPYIMRIWRRLK